MLKRNSPWKGKCVYISGPISNMPNNNEFDFNHMEKTLKDFGCKRVINPVALDKKSGKLPWHQAMKRDIRLLMGADKMVMLKGWQHSRGAILEKFIADNLQIEVVYASQP